MIRVFFVIFAAIFATAASVSAALAEQPVSIVLVHGAFVDGSGWQQVYDLLKKDGYEVIVVQNSTATLTGDVATTEQAIDRARHPVILVGHSYGGAVITEAGNDPKVRTLVYIAAFAPDEGQTVAELINKPVPGAVTVPVLPPENGFLIVDPAKFPKAFAADVNPALTSFMAASQVPWGLPAIQTKITQPAWKTKPSFFLVALHDHMIATNLERETAKQIGATTIEVSSSHAVMLSHPGIVASFIERAASSAKS